MSNFDSDPQIAQLAFSVPSQLTDSNPLAIASEIYKAKPVVLEPESVELRTAWPHEARDFSVWLEEHIERLEKAIGIHLTVVGREQKAEDFKADIIATDGQNNLIVIENQLEQTDHTHMGQIITYMSNFGAKTAIWITSKPREEHKKAVMWLNESTPEDISFYLIKLELYRIGDSEPGSFFQVIAGPGTTNEAKEIGKKRSNINADIQQSIRYRFWSQLLERAKSMGIKTHANRAATNDNWLGVGAGKSGLSFNYVISKGSALIDLEIHTGDKDRNKRIYDSLLKNKAAVEAAFGEPLSWERREENQIATIRFYLPGEGIQDESTWTSTQEKMINAMNRLYKALKPYVDNLPKKDIQDNLDNAVPLML